MQPDRGPELPKTYEPSEVEPRRYAESLAAGVFHEDPDPARPAFIISMPPPNITGRAHLGHGSTYTPMDILTRYHRMLGENADWLPGQDHAAIATETVLVRELAKEGLTRDGLGREAYLARAWEWREQYGNTIDSQFQMLGFGPDWDRTRFTMDPGLSAAVTRVFVQLYREGLIYRGTRLINWDIKAKSTLSDAEVEHEERNAKIWEIRYATEDGTASIVVATTRPETMLGDTAIAVHPDDARYTHLIGKNVMLPLMNRPIPVIADASVLSDFGTGAVKVTPAHDPSDYDIGQRHGLPMPSVIALDGTMTGDVGRYEGMDRLDARRAIVEDLRASGAFVSEREYLQKVSISSRSGEVIEPLLSLQWFCSMESLAKPAVEAYRSGKIRFVPERFGRTYENGFENLRDWNISRQVWWGHQLPVWYTPNDDVVVAETEEEALALAQRDFGTTELRRDPDTLDTWFSSGLWPFSILGWPDETPELAHWYPNQVMITSRDIIFLWIARMVMLGLHVVGDIPFRTVFVAPLVFDKHGRKMSKSRGDSIDPLDLIAEYGADATRFGIIKQMRIESQELRFDERACDDARRFNTKLWNALRFICSLEEGLPTASRLPATADLTVADKWILTRLRMSVIRITDALDGFEFGIAADELLDFGWFTFCDWYLEASKAPGERATRSAVLSYVFNAFVRLMHPIAPFITEEIWQQLPHDGATIVTSSWPDPQQDLAYYDGENGSFDRARGEFEAFIASAGHIRNVKAEMGLGPKDRLTLEVPPGLPDWIAEQFAVHAKAELVVDEARVAGPTLAEKLAAITARAPTGLLRERYTREVAKLDDEVARGEKKLANESFIAKANPDVVAKEREKLDGYRRDLVRVRDELSKLG